MEGALEAVSAQAALLPVGATQEEAVGRRGVAASVCVLHVRRKDADLRPVT
jgi:hypothetical protein